MSDVESGDAHLVADQSKQGIIYLLENEAFESPVIKIGRTGRAGRDLEARIRQLNTGVPLAFTCSRASLVNDAAEVEKGCIKCLIRQRGIGGVSFSRLNRGALCWFWSTTKFKT